MKSFCSQDGKTLAVANGGLDTVPDAGRANLNADTMEPSLTFVDRGSGELLAKHALPVRASAAFDPSHRGGRDGHRFGSARNGKARKARHRN